MHTEEPARRARDRVLARFYLVLTDRCNMRCAHCYRPKKSRAAEMSTAEVRHLIEQVAAGGLARQVTFTGGEPLLRGDFWQLVAAANQEELVVDVSTNAYRLQDRDFAELSNGRVQYLQVSVDGATRTTFEKMRGPGTYDSVVANLERIARLQLREYVDLSMVACVTPANYMEIRELVMMASKYGFNKVAFGEVMPVGQGAANYEKLTLSQTQLAEVYRQVRELRAKPVGNTRLLTQFYFGWQYDENYRSNVCTLATDQVATVGPTGDVFLCPYFYENEFALGNVREAPLKLILGNGRAEQIRQKYTPTKVECHAWEVCRGGCPVLGQKSEGRRCDPRCPK